MPRTRFPTSGIFTAIGGISECYYMNEEDMKRYRYLTPAEYVTETCSIGDCWIVDKQGDINPGTANSPVPFCREAIGRRVNIGGVPRD